MFWSGNFSKCSVDSKDKESKRTTKRIKGSTDAFNHWWTHCNSDSTSLFINDTKKYAADIISFGPLTRIYIISCSFWFYIRISQTCVSRKWAGVTCAYADVSSGGNAICPNFSIRRFLFGTGATGYVSPVGVSLVVGAFMFGIGMQLGGGCASGTLYAVGGGRSVAFVTLLFFIIGSTIGAAHLSFWTEDLPSFAPISLATSTGLGYGGAWIVSIILFGVIAWITLVVERKRKAPKMAPLPTTTGWKRIFRGSWPLFAAAIVLAVLNALTLMTRGTPWGITSAFALWGSKVAQFFGMDVASWGFWQGANAQALEASIFADSTTILNFGVILGAFLASAAGGLFKFSKVTLGNVLASIIGGLLMGYGSRLAFGCNVGAYFGGIASFSVHGYVWGILALAGTFVALYLRPLFGLSVPKSKDTFC